MVRCPAVLRGSPGSSPGSRLRMTTAGPRTMRAIDGLSPRSKPAVHCHHLVRSRGVLARRCVSGTGCGACGFRDATRPPGGAGAPPGPITRSRQELADDLAYRAFGLAARSAVQDQSKAGPGRRPTPQMSMRFGFAALAHFLCATAALLERVWRAGRRTPRSQKDRGHQLRICAYPARHPPLSLEGRKEQTPDAFASRERARMFCRELQQTPALPLWESTRSHCERGEGSAAEPRQNKQAPITLSAMARFARGGKPSPARGEGTCGHGGSKTPEGGQRLAVAHAKRIGGHASLAHPTQPDAFASR